MPIKKPLAVLDFETDPFAYGVIPEPFCAGYYDGKDYEVIWSEENCAEQLADLVRERDVICFAHNGGKFDFFFLLPWLAEDVLIINGRISQGEIGKCTLRDSYNILPIPLAAYKKDDMEYWKLEKKHRHKYRAEILAYLQSDCFYLYELVNKFADRFGRKLTLASAAMHELSTMIEQQHGKQLDRMNKYQDEKYRDFYYGGRCESFKQGELLGEYQIYDINSAYPFAMLHEHPDPTWCSFSVCSGLPKHPCYFAVIRAVARGCLPFRDVGDYRLSFPSDGCERIYSVTGWEIQAGLETGTLKILEIIEVRKPDRLMKFDRYVNRFYSEKVEAKNAGDKANELFAKLMLNSAYGKFALNPDEFKKYKIVPIGETPNEKENENPWELVSMWPQFDLDIYRKDDPSERGYFNVAVAASITGFVRAYLWRAICAAQEVIYCDTDSLVCKSFTGTLSDKLGDWKSEGHAPRCYIAGRKLYALLASFEPKPDFIGAPYRWKTASKGARLTPHEIYDLATGDQETVEWSNQFPTFSLRHGTRFIKRKIKKVSYG